MNTLIRKGEFMQKTILLQSAGILDEEAKCTLKQNVYFVIATATSSTQVKAISDEVEYKLDLLGVEPHHIEGRNTSWVCLDYNSVVIHIFHKQQRDFYSLERLWEDGEILDTAKLLED